MNTNDVAYIAGVMDSEGSFSITWNKHQGTTASSVAIANTDRRLLEFVQSVFGGKIYLQSRCHPGARNNCYQWLASADCIVNFLKVVTPFLKCKKEQAIVMLEHVQLVAKRGQQRPIPETIRLRRIELRNRMLELNKAKIKGQETVEIVGDGRKKWVPYIKLADRKQAQLLANASGLAGQ